MAHLFETGMFNRNIPAWHSLGTVIDNPKIGIEQAIKCAGLDWTVQEVPIYSVATDGTGRHAKAWLDHKGLVRDRDNYQLAIVGNGFEVLQNIDAFRWFEPFLSEGGASIDAAGSLDHGRKIWVTVKLGKQAEVTNGDNVESYLLLAHAHDGTLKVTCKFTPIRVVCNNTLTSALQDRTSTITVKHTRNLHAALKIVQEGVLLAQQTFAFTLDQYRALAKRDMGVRGFAEYVRHVFEVPTGEKVEDIRAWGKLLECFHVGRGTKEIPEVLGTVWGGYNAITEWVQHERGRSAETRLEAAWFGEGARVRDRAFKVALEVAGVPMK